MTAADLYVIKRRGQGTRTRGRRPGYGWTLHKGDCMYVLGAREAMPAPAQPYPGTVPCRVCKPGDEHVTRYAELPTGRWVAACTGCSTAVESTTKENARMMMVRRHRPGTTAGDGTSA
jgi:hypothetical protein